MANRYVPDLSAFDQFEGDNSATAMSAKLRVMRRNFELISKALNQIQIPTSTLTAPANGGNPSVNLEEKNYFTRIWQISKEESIASDDIYATTGIKVQTNGSLKIDGELKII